MVEVIYGDGQVAYFSWSGEYSQHREGVDVIQLNGLYARKLGIQEGEEVHKIAEHCFV